MRQRLQRLVKVVFVAGGALNFQATLVQRHPRRAFSRRNDVTAEVECIYEHLLDEATIKEARLQGANKGKWHVVVVD